MRNFTSATDTVQINNYASITNVPQLTYCFWYNRTGSGGGGNGKVFIHHGAGDLYYNSAVGHWTFNAARVTTTGVWRFDAGENTGQLYHGAITYDYSSTANDPLMYVDGVQYTITSETTAPVGAQYDGTGLNCYIGNTVTPTSNRVFNGYIGDFCIFNRVLAPGEIRTVRAYGPHRVPGLILYLPLDAGASTEPNYAPLGTKNNGSLVGTPPQVANGATWTGGFDVERVSVATPNTPAGANRFTGWISYDAEDIGYSSRSSEAFYVLRSQFRLDTQEFESGVSGETVEYYIDCVAQNDDSEDRDFAIVAAGDLSTPICSITIPAGTSAATYFARTSFTPLTGISYYLPSCPQTTGSDDLIVYNWTVWIKITNGWRCAIPINLVNRDNNHYSNVGWAQNSEGEVDSTAGTSYGQGDQGRENEVWAVWYRDDARWGTTNVVKWRFEANMQSNDTGYCRLRKRTDSSQIVEVVNTTGEPGIFQKTFFDSQANWDDEAYYDAQIKNSVITSRNNLMSARLWAIVEDVNKIDVYHRIGKTEVPSGTVNFGETRKAIPEVSGGNIVATDHVCSGLESSSGDCTVYVRGSNDTTGTTGSNIVGSALTFTPTSKGMVAVEGVDLGNTPYFISGMVQNSGTLKVNTQWVRIEYLSAEVVDEGDTGGGDITQRRCVRPWWWCR